jgi:hypothetical protein
MQPNQERAKQVILEVLKQAGGSISKAKLNKAFWLAHLYYAKENPGYLSDWPVVKMPNGPGIGRGEGLLYELKAAGQIAQEYEDDGPYLSIRCRLANGAQDSGLPPAAKEAARKAVAYVTPRSATDLSEWSYGVSRSWRDKQDGDELDIYADLIPDDVFEEQQRELNALNQAYRELFG